VWWVAVLVCLSGFSLARAGDQQPRLVVDQPVFDFGAVEQGERVEHVFKVRNGGTAPLRVRHVKSTCACTVGAVVGRELATDDETWVSVQLDTRELAGPTTKTITLYTNDPVHPAAGLSLTGTVLADVVVEPRMIYLGKPVVGDAALRTAQIRPGRPEGTARVTGVRAPQFLEARVVDGDEVGRQRLEVSLTPDAPPGHLHGDVVLETSGGEGPLITVPVFGIVRARPPGR
jgi:hypothetical protein